MSIASEITRIRNAKAAIKEVLESKGISVAEDDKLDDYVDLINLLPPIEEDNSGEEGEE